MKLDGTYGRPGHRRQRYKCTPPRGPAHVFTELLPREESWQDSCEQCERHVERREGPKAPRQYQFVARGIAEALHAVGAGATYMRASRVARDRAHRFRFDPETGELRESDHGQLVADWVELFAPIVFGPHRPRAWPAEGSLLLDHLPFRVRALMPTARRYAPAGSPSTFFARLDTAPQSRCSGAPRRSRRPIRPTGAPSSAPYRASRDESSAMPMGACCGRSPSAGRGSSCSSASGTSARA